MARKTADLRDILKSLNVRYPALEGKTSIPLGAHYFAFPLNVAYHNNKWPIRLKLVWHKDSRGPVNHVYGKPFMLIFSSGGHAHRIKWTPAKGWEISMNYNATHDGKHRWLDANDRFELVNNPLFPHDKCRKARAVFLHILERAADQRGRRNQPAKESAKIYPFRKTKAA